VTRLGLGTLVLGAIFLGAGWFASWSSVFALGCGLLLLLLLAIAYVVRRPHLEIDRQIHPARVPKGEAAIVYLSLRNLGRHTLRGTQAHQPYGSRLIETPLPNLLGGQSGIRTYRLPTARRGVFRIGPVEVSRSDPFGLAQTRQRFAGDTELWVYPKIYQLRSLASGTTRNLEGPTTDTAQEGTVTFHRLREYVIGDDLRMIHWKSTAKMGQLMIRQNVDTSQPYTAVLLDNRPSVYSAESFEIAVDLAASVITSAGEGKSPVQFRTTSGQVVGGTTHADLHMLLDVLTIVTPSRDGSIDEQLGLLRRDRGGTGLVVVTGPLAEEELPRIASMKQRFQRVVVVSVVPEPTTAPLFPGIRVVCGTSGEELADLWNVGVFE
jgi:uncharacterized protein (DUF58 family)